MIPWKNETKTTQEKFGIAVAGFFGGLAVALVASLIGYMVFVQTKADTNFYNFSIPILWSLGSLVAVISTRPAKAWRKLFITMSLLLLFLPITGFFAIGASSGMAVLAGRAFAAVIGFPAFFLAAICLISGLLIGRDKPQIVYR